MTELKDARKNVNLYPPQTGQRHHPGFKIHVVPCALSPAGCANLQRKTQQATVINERTPPILIAILNRRGRRP